MSYNSDENLFSGIILLKNLNVFKRIKSIRMQMHRDNLYQFEQSNPIYFHTKKGLCHFGAHLKIAKFHLECNAYQMISSFKLFNVNALNFCRWRRGQHW